VRPLSCPIPGTKRRTYLEQNAGAIDAELTDEDLARIDAEIPEATGGRYDEGRDGAVNLCWRLRSVSSSRRRAWTGAQLALAWLRA
jgi:aryl-alcohol dehydrogenase-like predicted oxidoreductase